MYKDYKGKNMKNMSIGSIGQQYTLYVYTKHYMFIHTFWFVGGIERVK